VEWDKNNTVAYDTARDGGEPKLGGPAPIKGNAPAKGKPGKKDVMGGGGTSP
jgi:hypothetical protein